MRKAILQIKTECHLYLAWDNSVKGAGHLETHHQLLAFCKSQLLKKPPAVCEFGGARFPQWSQWNHLANKNSDLTMCGKGLIQKRWCLATSYTEEGPTEKMAAVSLALIQKPLNSFSLCMSLVPFKPQFLPWSSG